MTSHRNHRLEESPAFASRNAYINRLKSYKAMTRRMPIQRLREMVTNLTPTDTDKHLWEESRGILRRESGLC